MEKLKTIKKPMSRKFNKKLKKIVLFVLTFLLGIAPNLACYDNNLPSLNSVSAADITAQAEYNKIGVNEFRGVWIASVFNVNFPSKTGLSAEQMKAELDDIVKNCKEANLNAIFFQVRPTGDALYDSGIFPTSKFLTGKQGDPLAGGFDPLKYIIQIAHQNNIELHAWINPYRITGGTAASPEQDLNALAPSNPARNHPEWTVKYPDGKLYYNPGLPEVRQLITDGVLEIVQKYNVDGIHFDDYFYPYPIYQTVNGKSVKVEFDDAAAYKKYGAEYSVVDDFRRASVNKLVQNVYSEIKKVNPNVRFGISPFGIWANESSISTGSKSSGFEGYFSLYADAKAWAEGGYIDYLCPQIYWEFGKKVAPYDVLVRWWSTLLDGTNVDLYIGHSLSKLSTDYNSELEIPRQVEYARSYISVKGSAFFGYADLAANTYKVKDNLKKLFAQPRPVPKPVTNGAGITIGRPANGTSVTESAINIMGGSDPAYPVYYNGAKVTRTKSGFFSVFVGLKDGKNNLIFTQNGAQTTHVVNKGASNSSGSSTPYVYPQMDSYKIEIISPDNDIITNPGDKVTLRVQAPSKSTVTAKLGGATISLTPLTKPPDEGAYMTEVYSGSITLPNTQPNGKMIDLGSIVFTATRNGNKETASFTGINVKLINESAYRPCEVIKDFASIKTSTDSGWWDDYLPASVGMRDNIVSFKDGYYKLGFGGYVSANDVVLMPEKTLLINRILSAAMENKGDITEIRFGVTENVPVDARCRDGRFNVKLYNTPDGGRALNLIDNPIFKKVTLSQNKEEKSVLYSFDLINADNFYGFDVVYEGGFIVIKVKNPMKKIEGDLPLKGLTIAIDPGHGGTDPGSIGFLGMKGKNEKDLNLGIALVLKDKLTALGANVVMTRDKDATVSIAERVDIFNKSKADLAVSIHHNSLPDTSDLSLVRGLLGLYCDEAGRLLAKSVSKATAAELNRFERDVRYQTLGVMRSHRLSVALMEMSFITNPDEFEFEYSPESVQRSADGIAKGIIAWIDNQAKFVK